MGRRSAALSSSQGSPRSLDDQPTVSRMAVRGAAELFASTAFVRAATLIAQIVMGTLLAEDDFGVYAIAISMGAFANILQDAGARLYLLQIDEETYSNDVGTCFWLSMAASVLAACLLVGSSALVSAAMDEPRILPVGITIAISIPILPVAMVNGVHLQRSLRFRAVARIDGISALLRVGSMMALAVAGFGAMSLALPILVTGGFRAFATYREAREAPWRRAAGVREWGRILSVARWVILGSISDVVTKESDYLVLGWLVPTAFLGYYYFGYQLVNASVQLVSSVVNRVLLPSLATIKGAAREASAMSRSSSAVSLIAAPSMFVLIPTIPTVEALIWSGKWSASVPIVQLLAFLFLPNILAAVPITLLQARGEFRQWSVANLWRGLLAPAAAAVAGLYVGNNVSRLGWLAVALGLYRFVTSLTYIRMCEKKLGLPRGVILRASARPIFAAGLAGVGAHVAGERIANELVSLFAACGVFLLIYLALVRLLMPRILFVLLGELGSKQRIGIVISRLMALHAPFNLRGRRR